MTFKDTEYGDMTGQQRVIQKIEVLNKPITSLQGSPTFIKGDFVIVDTNIKDLSYSPVEVLGRFDVSNNKQLTSLKGNLKRVKFGFDCTGCPNLTNPLKHIVENEIEALKYYTDDGYWTLNQVQELIDYNRKKTDSIKSKGFRTLLGLKNDI